MYGPPGRQRRKWIDDIGSEVLKREREPSSNTNRKRNEKEIPNSKDVCEDKMFQVLGRSNMKKVEVTPEQQ